MWNRFTSCFRIVSIYVILYLKIVCILIFKFIGNFRKNFSNTCYHVFAHIFISILLENKTWHLLLFELNSVNKVTKVSTLAPDRSVIILARHSPIVTYFDLNSFIFLQFLFVLLIRNHLLFLGNLQIRVKLLKCFDLTFHCLNVLLVFKSDLNNRLVFKLRIIWILINQIFNNLLELIRLI